MEMLLVPDEVDELFRYPSGRAQRLARRGLIPHIKLPDGEIRFEPDVMDRLLAESRSESACAEAAP